MNVWISEKRLRGLNILICAFIFPYQEAHKANRGFASELMDQYMHIIEPLTEELKETSSDFPPLLDLMECLKTFVKESKAHIETLDNDEEVEKIESYEEKVMELKQLIKHLQENEYEL